jgi:hypothetical protein
VSNEPKPKPSKRRKYEIAPLTITQADVEASRGVVGRLMGRTVGGTPTVGVYPKVEVQPTGGSSPAVGDLTAVHPTPVEIPPGRNSEGLTVGVPTVGESRPVGDPPTVRISVPWRDGELRVPNYIAFGLYPMLDLDERAVYQELYLWTWGFSTAERRLSQKKLCKSLRTTDKTLTRILRELEQKGLIEIGDAVSSGPREGRGTLFRVHLPQTFGKPEGERTARTGRRTPTVGEPPTVGVAPNMERESTREKTADVYEIRTIAARLFEAHRGEPGFDHERLRRLVRDALIGQGREVDDGAIEEAIRGMAG